MNTAIIVSFVVGILIQGTASRMTVFLRNEEGKGRPVNVGREANVGDVRRAAELSAYHRLSFAGQPLEDENLLSDFGIGQEAIIHVKLEKITIRIKDIKGLNGVNVLEKGEEIIAIELPKPDEITNFVDILCAVAAKAEDCCPIAFESYFKFTNGVPPMAIDKLKSIGIDMGTPEEIQQLLSCQGSGVPIDIEVDWGLQ